MHGHARRPTVVVGKQGFRKNRAPWGFFSAAPFEIQERLSAADNKAADRWTAEEQDSLHADDDIKQETVTANESVRVFQHQHGNGKGLKTVPGSEKHLNSPVLFFLIFSFKVSHRQLEQNHETRGEDFQNERFSQKKIE